jgi:hypothetical protein
LRRYLSANNLFVVLTLLCLGLVVGAAVGGAYPAAGLFAGAALVSAIGVWWV